MGKTREELLNELATLRQRVVEVEALEKQCQEAREALRQGEERYRTLFEQSADAVYVVTREGNLVDINQAGLDLFGYTREEMMQVTARQLYAVPADRGRFQQEIESRGFVKDYEVKLHKKGGTEMDCRLTTTVRRAADGSILAYQGIVRDITEQKRQEQQLVYMATHDLITGLPNRVLFRDRLVLALAYARRNQERLGVMMLDLDRFKVINDTLGHDVGDELLQAVGQRLTGLLRQSDTVSLLGGDEFMLLLPQIAEEKDARRVALKILDAFTEPFACDKHQLRITTSIGVTIYPQNGEDADTLIRNADIAMYHVKNHGRNNFQCYNEAMRAEAQE